MVLTSGLVFAINKSTLSFSEVDLLTISLVSNMVTRGYECTFVYISDRECKPANT